MARDGRRLVIRATSQRMRDGDGSLRFLICGQDLTELVGQRKELETQRDFLSAVGRATPSLLVIVDRDGTVAAEGTNYSFRELTGYDDAEAIGRPFWDLVAPPELVPEVKEAFEEQVASGVSLEHETAWIGGNGQWRIVAWWLRPLGEQSGKFVVCGIDVTERKTHEAELRASRSRIVEAATTSDSGSSGTFTTVRSSAWSRSRLRCGSPRRSSAATPTVRARSSRRPGRS